MYLQGALKPRMYHRILHNSDNALADEPETYDEAS